MSVLPKLREPEVICEHDQTNVVSGGICGVVERTLMGVKGTAERVK